MLFVADFSFPMIVGDSRRMLILIFGTYKELLGDMVHTAVAIRVSSYGGSPDHSSTTPTGVFHRLYLT